MLPTVSARSSITTDLPFPPELGRTRAYRVPLRTETPAAMRRGGHPSVGVSAAAQLNSILSTDRACILRDVGEDPSQRALLAQPLASGARHYPRCPPLEEGTWGGGRRVCDNHCSRGNAVPLLVAASDPLSSGHLLLCPGANT
eukprot:scaffold58915_cov118-Phaeocystis_antarctica.AAC.2